MIRQWAWFRWNPSPAYGRWVLTGSFRWVRAEVRWAGVVRALSAGVVRSSPGRWPGVWARVLGVSVDVRFRRRRSRRPWGPMREVP